MGDYAMHEILDTNFQQILSFLMNALFLMKS